MPFADVKVLLSVISWIVQTGEDEIFMSINLLCCLLDTLGKARMTNVSMGGAFGIPLALYDLPSSLFMVEVRSLLALMILTANTGRGGRITRV
eukprot:6206067-Pleurochrysis_carterae.AAC.2